MDSKEWVCVIGLGLKYMHMTITNGVDADPILDEESDIFVDDGESSSPSSFKIRMQHMS